MASLSKKEASDVVAELRAVLRKNMAELLQGKQL